MSAAAREAGAAPARLAALAALQHSERGGHADFQDEIIEDKAGADLAGAGPKPRLALLPRDRALTARLVKGVLRRRALLDALLQWAAGRAGARLQIDKTPLPNLWILRLAVFEKIFQGGAPDYAIGAQAVALARRRGGEPAARFVNAMVRRLFPRLPGNEAELQQALAGDPVLRQLPASERLSIPAEIIAEYERAYGAAADGVLAALSAEDAATWLRVNTLRAGLDEVRAELTAAGVETQAAPGGLAALRWCGGTAPWQTDAWARGALVVQDLAAQLAGWLLAPEPGEAVADLCAAPGGKTGHLWELMGGRGRLMAWERDPVRRGVLMQNVERLHGAKHGIDLPQGEGEGPLGDAAAAGGFDAVLLDAPCQALGLIRRHPEARWDDRLQERGAVLTTQRGLLTAGARLVRPGGRLLWVTCSPTRAENEDQVALFLAGHPEWDTERGVVPTGLDTLVQWTGDTLRTRPDAAPWDGFAYTLLRRMP